MKLTEFLADETAKAKDALLRALDEVPSDRRTVSPGGEARTPINLIAECAVMNLGTATMLRTRSLGNMMETYMNDVAGMEAKSEPELLQALNDSIPVIQSSLREFDESHLEETLDFPWGPMSFAEICAYPYWNMKYHEGQIYMVSSLTSQPVA